MRVLNRSAQSSILVKSSVRNAEFWRILHMWKPKSLTKRTRAQMAAAQRFYLRVLSYDYLMAYKRQIPILDGTRYIVGYHDHIFCLYFLCFSIFFLSLPFHFCFLSLFVLSLLLVFLVFLCFCRNPIHFFQCSNLCLVYTFSCSLCFDCNTFSVKGLLGIF